MITFTQRTSKYPESPYDVRIPPGAKHIIPVELKHDAAFAADIDVNRFGRRCWAEFSAYQTSK